MNHPPLQTEALLSRLRAPGLVWCSGFDTVTHTTVTSDAPKKQYKLSRRLLCLPRPQNWRLSCCCRQYSLVAIQREKKLQRSCRRSVLLAGFHGDRAKSTSWAGKVIPATPSCEPCELQYQPARQDMFTDNGDGGSQQLSCCVLGPFHRRNPNFVKAHLLRSQALQVTCLLWGHIFKDLWGPFRFLSALRPYQSLLRFRLEGKVHVLGIRMFSRLFSPGLPSQSNRFYLYALFSCSIGEWNF